MEIYNRQSGSPQASLTKPEENVLQLMLEGHDESFITRTLDLPQQEMEFAAASGYAKIGVNAFDYEDRVSSAIQKLVNQTG